MAKKRCPRALEFRASGSGYKHSTGSGAQRGFIECYGKPTATVL